MRTITNIEFFYILNTPSASQEMVNTRAVPIVKGMATLVIADMVLVGRAYWPRSLAYGSNLWLSRAVTRSAAHRSRSAELIK